MKDKDKLQEAILKADMKSAEKIWKELDGEQTLASLLEKMTKDELVKIAKKYDVKLWRIASKLHINDGNFSRKLRHELPEEEKRKIYQIIDELANE